MATVIAIVVSRMHGVASAASAFMAFCSRVLVAKWGGDVGVERIVPLAAVLLIVASATGALSFIVRATRDGAALRRALRDKTMLRSRKAERASADIGMTAPTVVTDTDAYAFTSGLLRPRIVLSSGLVSKLSLGELKAVLRHERRHQLRHDPLRTFLGALASRAFFWVPALRDVVKHCALAREVAADRAALVGSARHVLASALLKTVASPFPATVAFGQFSHRVDALAHPSDRIPLRIATWRIFATAAVLVATLSGGSAGAAADDGSASLCVDAAAVRTTSGGFTPFVRIMTDAAPMSEAGQFTPDVR